MCLIERNRLFFFMRARKVLAPGELGLHLMHELKRFLPIVYDGLCASMGKLKIISTSFSFQLWFHFHFSLSAFRKLLFLDYVACRSNALHNNNKINVFWTNFLTNGCVFDCEGSERLPRFAPICFSQAIASSRFRCKARFLRSGKSLQTSSSRSIRSKWPPAPRAHIRGKEKMTVHN